MSADPLKDEKPVASSLPGEVKEPNAPTGPKLPPQEAPSEPTPEEKSKQEFIAFMNGLPARINAIEENQAKLVKILEANNSVARPNQQQGGGALGGLDLGSISNILSQFGLGGASDPLAEMKMQIGDKFITSVLDTAVKNVVKQMSPEAAIHVTHG